MSLVIGLKAQGRVVIAGDSICTSGTVLAADEPKVAHHGVYVVGTVGSGSVEHEFLHGLDWQADWFAPGFLRDRVVTQIRALKGLYDDGGDHSRFDLAMLVGRGPELFCMNEVGQVWPESAYNAIGVGDSIALYLLRKQYRPEMTVVEAAALATYCIEEVCSVSHMVRLPVTWLVTEP